MEHNDITPAEARAMLARADIVSRRTHQLSRWPYLAFLVALGAATSLGTLAMGLSDGSAFTAMYLATLLVGVALVVGLTVAIRGRSTFARSRRWSAYMAAWAVAYALAIVAATWGHGSVLWSGLTSALLLVVTLGCVAREARR